MHARSGDKGGDANLGLWVAHDGSERYADRVTWLASHATGCPMALITLLSYMLNAVDTVEFY